MVLEFGIDAIGDGGGKGVRRAAKGKHDRPWRKPAAEIKAEREKTAAILGKSGGVDLDAVRTVMAVQELVDVEQGKGDGASAAHSELQAAATTLRQVATNARPPEEVAASRAALDAAVEAAGLSVALSKRLGSVPSAVSSKLQLLHEVMPRLWVGGWAALNDDCGALRQRRVTHVVSVLSADQRRLPPFVKGHHYVRVDDTEDAAPTLAAAFEGIVAFIEEARASGGIVFVHCGAGISRAPTSACAYLIWKLRIPAADAIKLVRSARACTRPNAGFVSALRTWEKTVLAAPAAVMEAAGSEAPSAVGQGVVRAATTATAAPSAAQPAPNRNTFTSPPPSSASGAPSRAAERGPGAVAEPALSACGAVARATPAAEVS